MATIEIVFLNCRLDGATLVPTIRKSFDRQRFADVFREVWQGIPAVERQVMVGYRSEGIVGQDHSPQIKLLANYDRPGNNDRFGNALTFNSCVADLLDAADLRADLIDHELGHVFRYSTKSPAHTAFPPSIPAKEDKADVKAVEWGYSMQALRNVSMTLRHWLVEFSVA